MKAFLMRAKSLLLAMAIIVIGVVAQRFIVIGSESAGSDLQPVSITEVNSKANSVAIQFNHSPDGPQVKVRVDPAGGGDVKTIAEALKIIDDGEIAISAGRHMVQGLTIPAGVVLAGGYDPQTWTFSPDTNVTTLVPEDPKDSTALIRMLSGSVLYAVVIDGADTALDLDGDGVVVQGVGISHSRIGIMARSTARGVVNYVTLVHNQTAMIVEAESEISVQNTIFTNNYLGLISL